MTIDEKRAAETFLYFSYGSNMLSSRLKARTPSAIATGIGHIEGRLLNFDKISTDAAGNTSGKVTINRTSDAGARVWGVLYTISLDEMGALDAAEGVPTHYRQEDVQVVTNKGTVTAKAYVAVQKTPSDPTYLPYHWYKALVVAGAAEHHLPVGYTEWLRTFASQEDPDPIRRAEGEAILFSNKGSDDR